MDKEFLHKYFAGNTTPDEEREIINWCKASPDNCKEYLEERKWWNAFLVGYETPPEVKGAKQGKTVNLWLISTVAASIALLVALAHIYNVSESTDDKWQSVWVPPGQRVQVTLADGTRIWLNSQSTLSYPASFKGNKRIVRLDGEGYFEVEKNKKKPFIVDTKNYDIEVLGTTFNVFAYGCNGRFETSLINGSVKINSKEINAPEVTLKPDEMVVDAGGALKVKKIDHYDHFRWKEGLICLDNERFENMMKEFSLYFDIKITIENPKLADYRCTGKFRHSDGVDYAIKVLQAEMNFTYSRDKESNEIIIK